MFVPVYVCVYVFMNIKAWMYTHMRAHAHIICVCTYQDEMLNTKERERNCVLQSVNSMLDMILDGRMFVRYIYIYVHMHTCIHINISTLKTKNTYQHTYISICTYWKPKKGSAIVYSNQSLRLIGRHDFERLSNSTGPGRWRGFGREFPGLCYFYLCIRVCVFVIYMCMYTYVRVCKEIERLMHTHVYVYVYIYVNVYT